MQLGGKSASVELAAGTMQLDKFVSVYSTACSKELVKIVILTIDHRDFVLLIRTAAPHEPRVCVEIGADGTTATMITLAPNIQLAEERCELIFVIDRSGSMSGSKINNARSAMTVCCLCMIGEDLIVDLPHSCSCARCLRTATSILWALEAHTASCGQTPSSTPRLL